MHPSQIQLLNRFCNWFYRRKSIPERYPFWLADLSWSGKLELVRKKTRKNTRNKELMFSATIWTEVYTPAGSSNCKVLSQKRACSKIAPEKDTKSFGSIIWTEQGESSYTWTGLENTVQKEMIGWADFWLILVLPIYKISMLSCNWRWCWSPLVEIQQIPISCNYIT